MMGIKKWFVKTNRFHKIANIVFVIPSIAIFYDKNSFLETGVTSPEIAIHIIWLHWEYEYSIQKGY
jgi:hypothetical protein